MTPDAELLRYEAEIQKVYERLQQCQNRGTNASKQRERYERMVRAWRLQVEQEEDNND